MQWAPSTEHEDKRVMISNYNQISALRIDSHKPGESIPCKGLKPENMKKIAEL